MSSGKGNKVSRDIPGRIIDMHVDDPARQYRIILAFPLFSPLLPSFLDFQIDVIH
jgi:hypothetical protein